MDDKTVNGLLSIVQIIGGNGWESNPPRPATRPATGVEDQEAHRDLTTPVCKDNREKLDSQVNRFIFDNYPGKAELDPARK